MGAGRHWRCLLETLNLEQLVKAVRNVGTPAKDTEQVPVLKRTVFEGKDSHTFPEFLQLQLSNRHKEQR